MTVEQIINNISASFEIEGMIMTAEEKKNLMRVANGEITYEELKNLYIEEVLVNRQ